MVIINNSCSNPLHLYSTSTFIILFEPNHSSRKLKAFYWIGKQKLKKIKWLVQVCFISVRARTALFIVQQNCYIVFSMCQAPQDEWEPFPQGAHSQWCVQGRGWDAQGTLGTSRQWFELSMQLREENSNPAVLIPSKDNFKNVSRLANSYLSLLILTFWIASSDF